MSAVTHWRSRLLATRIVEFEFLGTATERELRPHAGDDDGTMLHARETLADAELWLIREALDYAKELCAHVERELIASREADRNLGALL